MPLLTGGVLRHRDYRILFAGQAVSVVGDALFPIALAFARASEGLDGTPTQLGVVLAAQVVPMTFLVLAAGVWADRVSRRRLMLVSDVGRGAVQAAVAALLLSAAPSCGISSPWSRSTALRGLLPPGGRRPDPAVAGRRRAAAGERADRPRPERRDGDRAGDRRAPDRGPEPGRGDRRGRGHLRRQRGFLVLLHETARAARAAPRDVRHFWHELQGGIAEVARGAGCSPSCRPSAPTT